MFGLKKIDRNQIDTTLLPVLLACLLVFFTCSVDARDNNSIVSNPDWHNQANPQWGSGSSQFTQQPSRSITPTGSHQTRTITVRESKPQTNTNTTAAGSTANQAPPQTNTQSTNFSDSKDYARLYSAAAAAHDAGNTQEEERIIQSLPEDQRAGARVFVNDGGVTPVSHAVDVAIAVGGAAAIRAAPLLIESTTTKSVIEKEKTLSPTIDPKEIAGKSANEIDKFAKDKGLIVKGSNPKDGKGAYLDPQTNQQRVLIHSKPENGCPHCHVNDANGNRLDINGVQVPKESNSAHLPLNTQ